MKCQIILFVLFCIVSFLKTNICFSESNNVDVLKNFFSIAIEPSQHDNDKYQYLSTEPMPILVSINNDMGQLSWFSFDGSDDFGGLKVKILRENMIVPLVPSLQGQKNIFRTSSMMGHDFRKNKIFTFWIKTLNKHYDMSLDGEYVVSMECCVYDINKNSIISRSNELKIIINNSSFNKFIFSNSKKNEGRPNFGTVIILTMNQDSYKNLAPIYLRIGTKNVSKNNHSMMENTDNVLDMYNLILKTPGQSRDFRKPKGKDDINDAELTLYGQKLLSEKSKEPKPMVMVKPGEEAAEAVVVLNRIFDMSEDGIYGLIVSRKIIDADGKEQTVTSDPLPIRIGTALTQDEIDQRVKEREEQEKNNAKK